MDLSSRIGTLEVITGCMFSGKSEELIRRVRRAKIAKQKVIVFKPSIDNRYNSTGVVSHSGISVEAIPVEDPSAILRAITLDTQVVAVDEVQFFPSEIKLVLEELVQMGLRVIAAGLDMDFRGEPFGYIPDIMAIANKVDKLEAVCSVCGAPAYYTQRIINDKPASYYDPIILVGAIEFYEARCQNHHNVEGHPRRKWKN